VAAPKIAQGDGLSTKDWHRVRHEAEDVADALADVGHDHHHHGWFHAHRCGRGSQTAGST